MVITPRRNKNNGLNLLLNSYHYTTEKQKERYILGSELGTEHYSTEKQRKIGTFYKTVDPTLQRNRKRNIPATRQ